MGDLKALKNNKLRQAFLEELKESQEWYTWFSEPRTDRKFKRVDIASAKASIVCELRREQHFYPKDHIDWFRNSYYIIPTKELENRGRLKPFSAYRSSMSECIEKIKEIQRA